MLAVAGGKGGVGKTTTAFGLGLAAARAGRPALAVDADVDMPDLHRLAGVDRSLDGRGPAGAQEVPGERTLTVLPVPTDDDVDDRGETLAEFRSLDRPVLVDCPAGAGRDAAAPMRAADATLLVVRPDPAAVTDAAKTAAMSRAVGTPLAGVVVAGARRPPQGIGAALDTTVLGAIPPRASDVAPKRPVRRFSRLLDRLPHV